MAGGYTGNLIALDVDSPNYASALAQGQKDNLSIQGSQLENDRYAAASPLLVQQQQQQNERYGADTPLLLASDQMKNQQSELALAEAKRQDQLQTQAFQNRLIAEAASKVDPNDPDAAQKWDEAMQKAAADGAPGATQFVGRYNPALHQRVTQAYAAESPLAAHAALASGGMVAPSPMATATGGTAPGLDGGIASQLDQAPIEQVQAAIPKLKAVRDALVQVANSQDPEAAWQAAAHQLGLPQFAGHYSPLRLQQLYAETEPVLDHLQARIDREGTGLPAPAAPWTFKDVNGGLIAVNPSAPGGPQAKTLVEPKGKYSFFTGADGKTYRADANTGDVEAIDENLVGKVSPTGAAGSAGRPSVFEQRRQAYLAVHPDDNQGALDYASGHRQISPADATKAAYAEATREFSAMSAAGTPPQGDPQAWIQSRANQVKAELTADHADVTKAEQVGIPARAVAQLKEGKPTPFANGQVWTLKNGKPVRLK